MAIYGTPAVKILDEQTDRIGILTVVLGLIWQPSKWPMSFAQYYSEQPAPPQLGGGVEYYGRQTRPFGGCLQTTWTYRGISGSGKDVTFKDRRHSIDYKFEPGFAQVSLLLHPRIQAFLAAYGGAVQDGQIIWPPTLASAGSTIGSRAGAGAGKTNPMFGQQDFFRMEGTYTFRYAAFNLQGLDNGVGTAMPASALPGVAQEFAGRDYLKIPPIYERVGPVYDITESYWLSGEGGWPKPVYGGGGASSAQGAAADAEFDAAVASRSNAFSGAAAGGAVSSGASDAGNSAAADGSGYSVWQQVGQAATAVADSGILG